jgi:trypsin
MVLAVLLAGGVAQAIINGEPDTGEDAHPYVGALVSVFEGDRVPVCSGTLISPTVFLTAGHCTDLLIDEALPTFVSFDPTYEVKSSEVIPGTPSTHPKADLPEPANPLNTRYDVGVVVLDKPVRMATYGALPEAGLVDTLEEGHRLTVVGYGATGFDVGGEPPPLPQPVYPDDRYNATLTLFNPTNDVNADMFVRTKGPDVATGDGEGACKGDSGGPLFLPDQETIVGVYSFSLLRFCRGPGYYQQVDIPRVLSWVHSYL